MTVKISATYKSRSMRPMHRVFGCPCSLFLQDIKKHGYGSEAVASVIETVQDYGDYRRMGVNVYAENIHAFRFWYQQGFCRMTHFEPEQDEGREYHCVVLYRDLETDSRKRQ